jgi:hypothetical protein
MLAQPGDYLTGQMLNDIRDALNQCVRTLILAGGFDTGSLVTTWYNVQIYNPGGAVAPDFSPPDNIEGFGSGTSIANADANYTGGHTSAWGSGFYGFREVMGYTSVSYSNYHVEDQSSVFAAGRLYPVPYAFTANWYFMGAAFDSVMPGLYAFDAQGTTALNLQWQQFGTTIAAASVDCIVGPLLPGASPVPAPNWSNKGWECAFRVGILEWDVAGGFLYVAGYAGT